MRSPSSKGQGRTRRRDEVTAACLVAGAVADGVPTLGRSVIVDAVNAVEAARGRWRAPAGRHRVPVVFIEVVCSDSRTHRQRLESRSRDIAGFEEPTWEAVREGRAAFEPWADHRLLLDSIADLASNVT
ncbi:AAA family ATPase [Streptomyces sp. B3I8]|uniref:AAA family ATPase n=1 Tax=Streptomyces sp. B3I8 TaxID=3042303 RepID=UPI00278459C4|nr:AAA family ATPase [Streptomyces sp. B3I8]MDQ0786871.1 putative kinase [Streptomyces sp. B3I8]